MSAVRAAFFALLACVACGGDTGSASSTAGSASGASTATDAAGSTTSTGSVGGGGSAGACPGCGDPAVVCTPQNAGIIEASGLVASAVHVGVFYAHNDSGDTARFFAIGPACEDYGTYRLPGAAAVDWEGMARGPCADPSQSCLYLGDIGDNAEARASYTVYRVEEPVALSSGDHDVAWEALDFTYPDGPHNAETLLVHPTTGVVTVVTKDALATGAYAFPLPLAPGRTATLQPPTDVVVPDILGLVTGGDVHPSGASVLLRTYSGVWHYAMGPGETVGQALSRPPCEVPSALEQQGETVAWSMDGGAYFTLSEGAAQDLERVTCR